MDPGQHVAHVAHGVACLQLDGPRRGVALAQGREEALLQRLAPGPRHVPRAVVEVHGPLLQQPQRAPQEAARRRVELGRRTPRAGATALLLDPDEEPLVGGLQDLRGLVQDVDARGLLAAGVEHLPRVRADLLEAREGLEELVVHRLVARAHQLRVGLGEPEPGQEFTKDLLLLLDDLGLVPQAGGLLQDRLRLRLACTQLGTSPFAGTLECTHESLKTLDIALQFTKRRNKLFVQQQVLPFYGRPQISPCVHGVLIEEAGKALQGIARRLGIDTCCQCLLNLLHKVAAWRMRRVAFRCGCCRGARGLAGGGAWGGRGAANTQGCHRPRCGLACLAASNWGLQRSGHDPHQRK
mmetsp:Transcript_78744/g.222610  ORF Transcript_78744/g.222610 Transcript_78744/m.222610 type:complete len:353 (+) Transcript_78744:810-1868(+)